MLRYLSLPLIAMATALGLTVAVLEANPQFLIFPIFPSEADILGSLIVVALIVAAGTVATVATFMVFQRGGERLSRVIMAAFMSPMFFLLTVFIGEAILLILIRGLDLIHYTLIAMASIYFALLSVVFILTDALSVQGRNVIFAVYGLILGVFLGCMLSWYSTLALVCVLAAEDTLFAAKLGPTVAEADPSQHARSAFVFRIGRMVMGVGDLVVFATLVSYALRFFGWGIALATLIAVAVGCSINSWLAAGRPGKVLPGLPIPLLCALAPIIPSLAMVTWIGLVSL